MSGQFSYEIARWLGEEGRSVSQRIGDGITNFTGGWIPNSIAKELGHLIMAGVLAGSLSKNKSSRNLAGWGTLGLGLMWIAGEKRPIRNPSQL